MHPLPRFPSLSAAARTKATLALVLVSALAAACAPAQHERARHGESASASEPLAAARADNRQAVAFPEPMKTHTLSNMRDHLVALSEIQLALAQGAFDTAAATAEQRLGMGSLATHGAHDLAGFMPAGMQDIGTLMHRRASRFAIEAQNSAATGDLKPALAALAGVVQTCTACHAAYRLQ